MSSVAAVSETQDFLTDANWTPGSSRATPKTLTQDDFLTLVVAEMSNQDPLNPTSNTEYIAQMAQFSALEQSKSVQKEMSSMQASSLIGRTVSVKYDKDGKEESTDGVVTSVRMENGTPKLELDNSGAFYSMDSLLSIKPTTTATTTTS